MEYVEIICTVQLNKNLNWKEAQEIIGNNINYALLKKSRDFHKAPHFKGYSFSNFYPAQKDGIYKKNNIYMFTINVIKQNYAKHFKRLLQNYSSQDFKVLAIQESNRYVKNTIEYLFTQTPMVIRLDHNKVWTNGNLNVLVEQLNKKMIKKYKQFFNEELECDFIEQIKILSKSPIILKYKNFHYAGIKVEIVVNKDEQSQKLAQLAKITGLGDLNSSLGCGFTESHYFN